MAKLSNQSLFLMLIIGACWLACAKEKNDQAADEKKEEDQSTGTVIGIDLGTTYSCVGVFKNGKVEIIPNDQGNRITPSYVAFTQEGERLIGDAAKNQLTSNPENTIFDVKRLIGRSWDDPSVQRDVKYYPYTVVNKNQKPYIEAKTAAGLTTFSPEEISAMVLGKMRDIAEAYLGKPIKNAVVTVPAYFNDAQRSATRDAGTIAGLNVMRIINEPTAAAIAYGIDKKGGEKCILVFDLGGGTFDVSLLTIDNGIFEVVATNGNTHLGGEDFDQRTMEYFIKMYQKKTGKDIKKDNRAVQKLRREVEKAKRALSNTHQVKLEIESLLDGEDFVEILTRAKFEVLNMELFLTTLEPLKNVLADAHLSVRQVDEIVLVGGSTRIPKIRELVIEFFNGKEPSQGINPDEAVAYGAAVQGGVLSGDEDTGDVVLLDVIPLTLGLETEGGRMSVLIPRNTVIPTKKSQIFSTVADGQTAVEMKIFEGERPFVADNHLLGAFLLTGLLGAPRGIPQIEVTFDIDVNGILKVTAEDKGTGATSHIVISNDQNRLSAEDVERMVKESEKYSEADKIVRETFEARSDLEKEVYKMKNQLADEKGVGGKLTEKEKEPIQTVVDKTIEWLDNNQDADYEAIRAKKVAFDDAMKPVLNLLYQKNKNEQEKAAQAEDDDDDEEEEDEDERDEL